MGYMRLPPVPRERQRRHSDVPLLPDSGLAPLPQSSHMKLENPAKRKRHASQGDMEVSEPLHPILMVDRNRLHVQRELAGKYGKFSLLEICTYFFSQP